MVKTTENFKEVLEYIGPQGVKVTVFNKKEEDEQNNSK